MEVLIIVPLIHQISFENCTLQFTVENPEGVIRFTVVTLPEQVTC